MIEWWWLLPAAYLGCCAGSWFVLTIRDGRPWENLYIVTIGYPVMILGFLADR